jgi:hypothetical protein
MVIRETAPRLCYVGFKTDATNCPCYEKKFPQRRELALWYLKMLDGWDPDNPLKPELSDALAVVDAVHEWHYANGSADDMVRALKDYEAGQ